MCPHGPRIRRDCKACLAEYYRAWRVTNSGYAATYRQNNKEKIAKQKADWRDRNKEKLAKAAAAYRKAHPDRMAAVRAARREKIAIAAAAYHARPDIKIRRAARVVASREASKEQRLAYNAYMATWHAAHPEHVKAHAHKRRARKAAAPGGHYTVSHARALFISQLGRCKYCNIVLAGYHIEHMMPLARGGSNGPENICLSCPRCNLRKGSRTAEEFTQWVQMRARCAA